MIIMKLRAENVSNSTLREKEISKNARRETLEPSILRLRVFSAENNLKGNATARWALLTTEFEWSQPCKVERK